MVEHDWTPSRHGGLRRPRSSSTVERHPDLVEARKSPEKGSGGTVEGVHAQSQETAATNGTGFNSLLRDKKWKYTPRTALGVPGCEYVIRWMVETPLGSVRLHHWLAPDDDRAPHDHPWSFTTFVLRGGYYDLSPTGSEHLRAPAVRRRAAEHPHTVFPDRDGAWTIIVTGPKVRQWGFWVKGANGVKFVKSYRYFYKYGHHPCD